MRSFVLFLNVDNHLFYQAVVIDLSDKSLKSNGKFCSEVKRDFLALELLESVFKAFRF